MKIISGYIFRALCSILLGLLFILKSQQMDKFLMMIIGGLFCISGVFTIIYYLIGRFGKKNLVAPRFPYVSAANILMGAALIFYAEQFASILLGPLVILLGIFLALAGFGQITSLFTYRRIAPIGFFVMIMPVLLLGTGLFLIFHPMDSVAITFQVLGCACVYYGVSDLFLAIRLRHYGHSYSNREPTVNNTVSEKVDESEYVDFEVINSQQKND